MRMTDYRTRVRAKCRRLCADHLFRRPFAVDFKGALISFTFDDFPRTALSVGGSILERYGRAGTYYASLGLAGKQDASGPMFTASDLVMLREHGHELGCHTFTHCDSSETSSSVFLDSVVSNQRALEALFPGTSFQTFSFPKSAPRVRAKMGVGRRFECCRGGGQTFNAGVADLNYLKAYFLEQARGDLNAVERIIDRNREAKGWLIFATHDVCESPSPYGCTPEFFDAVVRYAVDSGADILPVVQALERLRESTGALRSKGVEGHYTNAAGID
jgi:peptidoglycan/xylan/chitin deacetylase (PgdA/CDA1 family)